PAPPGVVVPKPTSEVSTWGTGDGEGVGESVVSDGVGGSGCTGGGVGISAGAEATASISNPTVMMLLSVCTSPLSRPELMSAMSSMSVVPVGAPAGRGNVTVWVTYCQGLIAGTSAWPRSQVWEGSLARAMEKATVVAGAGASLR